MVLATTIAQSGQSVAVGWDIYERTGSALALGWVGVAQFVPTIVLFLPAGQIADRFDRRRIVAISLALWVSAAALLALTSWNAVAWSGAAASASPLLVPIYAAVAMTGAAILLNRAARDALLPSIVPASSLAEAMAWNSSLYQTASMLGPALAGGLIAWHGSARAVYLLNALCLLIAIIAVLAIRAAPRRLAVPTRRWRDLFGGVVHVWRERIVLGLVAIDLIAMMFGTVIALLPVFAKDVLQVGAQGLGLLSAAPAVGAFAMALAQGIRRPYKRAGPAFLMAIATFGVAVIVFGLSRSLWLSFAALVVAGAADNIGAIVRQTIIQLRTPDELRGRVSAVNRVMISASNELSAMRAGAAATLFGPVAAAVGGGVVMLAMVVIGARLFPELRQLHQMYPADK